MSFAGGTTVPRKPRNARGDLRQANGKEDMCGDMVYTLTVKPALLASTDARSRALLLAMCTDPFWTRAEMCVGYRPAKTGAEAWNGTF